MTITAIPRPRKSDEALTIDEVLSELRVARSTFNDWRAKKTAPRCIKLPNGQLRVRRAVLEKWIQDREECE